MENGLLEQFGLEVMLYLGRGEYGVLTRPPPPRLSPRHLKWQPCVISPHDFMCVISSA